MGSLPSALEMRPATARAESRTSAGTAAAQPEGMCILCGSARLVEDHRYSAFLDLPGHSSARARQCKACGMRFLDPYPDAHQLEQLYSQSYFETDNAAGFDGEGTQISYDGVAELRMKKFQATVEVLERFMPPPARLLDVGTATGEFLDVARRKGYEVAGIELSNFAAEKARAKLGLDVFVGPLDAYTESVKFDIAHLSHVMEHLAEPHGAIEKLGRLLSPNGIIYIEVPFQWSWVEQLHFLRGHRQKFSAFSVHHRSFFRPDTLRAFFSKHGFECRHLTLTPPHRYPASGLAAQARRLMWGGLSLMGQGLWIEAVFSRSDAGVKSTV